MSSAICFNSEKSAILSSGNRVNRLINLKGGGGYQDLGLCGKEIYKICHELIVEIKLY